MEYREMSQGIKTSLLGFGCMRFPKLENGSIDEVESQRMLDMAMEAGVNYYDTAYPYHNGESEPFLGKALKKYERSSFYLASKLPVWLTASVEDAKRIFEEQLERLQTDYIDYYLLHALNKDRWKSVKETGVLDYVISLKEEGRIKNLGFSFHDSYEVFEEILNYREWDFCQIQLNYKDAKEQAGLKGYELTVEKQVPLVIMEPVKGGLLAGFSKDINKKFEQLDAGASIASYAFRWVGSLPNVKVILSGMSTIEQVEDNLNTFKEFHPLTEEEQAVIADVVNTLEARVQNGCTACRYCMPCPAGVDIPGSFRLWNQYHIYQNYKVVENGWENELPPSTKPVNCIKCGKCEAVCPQGIPIREHLAKAQSDLDKKEMIL